MVSFIAEREPMLDALRRVCGVVDDKSTIPVLSHVLIEADLGKRVTIIGTNINVLVKAFVPADIDAAGSFAVVAQPLLKSVTHGVGADVQFKENGKGQAAYTIGRSRFQSNTMLASDFPAIEMATQEAKLAFDLPPGFFAAIKKRHAYIVDPKDPRPALAGIGFMVDGKKLVTMSGASCGGSVSEWELPKGAEDMPSFILPADSLDWFVDTEPKDGAKLEVSDWFVRLAAPLGSVTSKLLEFVYPDVRKAIPTERRMVAKLDRKEVVKSLLRAEAFADVRHRAVRFSFSPDKVLIESAEGSDGSASTEVATDSAFTFSVGFAAKPLRLCLESFDCEVIQMAIGEQQRATVISDANDASRTALAMPYALRNDVAVAA